jgi:prepilin-type N-terminal cleavage/methylation domain-containing protein
MDSGITQEHGFTLIEVIIVVVIAGILVTVALRSAGMIANTARTEETKQELEALATAMIGNPELENNGVRSDFGYVGDVGAMPPNLDALYSNPGSYATWRGPYIDNEFTQKTDDYKKDAWDAAYAYGGVNITSHGSGSDIVRTLGKSTDDFTLNQVKGIVLDLDGTPRDRYTRTRCKLNCRSLTAQVAR